MKTTLISLLLLIGFFAASTQTVNAQTQQPKKEYTIALAQGDLTIYPGETKEIEVFVNRSKSFRKTKISLETGNRLPEGIEVSFKAPEVLTDPYVMTISTSNTVAEKNMMLIVNAKSARVKKGTMLKLNIASSKISSNE